MTNAHAFGEAASRTAIQVDSVFLFIAAVCLFFFLLVEGLLIYFAIRYRRRRGQQAGPSSDVTSNVVLETVWVVIPSVVVIAFFVYGYIVFRDLRAPRAGATDINVIARQFLFEFRYPDGRNSIGELRLPAGSPVKLVMTSRDVIHGFFIPDYRIKQDVLPGQYTTLYIDPDRPGTYDIFCTQYCGTGHATMRAKLVVMPPEEYARWKAAGAAGAALPPAEKGKALVERSGCLGCHSIDGTAKVGPTFKGLFGRQAALQIGKTVIADEEYIRESIYDPGAKVVKGFPNVMPTFKGTLSADDVSAIIAYLKVLGGREAGEAKEEREKEERAVEARPSPERGKELAEKSGCFGCHSVDGSRKVGPTWKGLYGSRRPLADGRTVTADEAYLRESIEAPGAKVVKGYPAVMPAFKGTLSANDIASIIAYIKTLR